VQDNRYNLQNGSLRRTNQHTYSVLLLSNRYTTQWI